MAGGARERLALMWPGNSGDLVKFAGVVGVQGDAWSVCLGLLDSPVQKENT